MSPRAFPTAAEIRSRAALGTPEAVRQATYVWGMRLNALLHVSRHSLQRSEGFRPFFIVGAPRSGNTLLRRLITSHPDLSIPAETYVLGSVINLYLANRHLPWEVLVELTLARFEYHFEFHTMNIPTLRPLALHLKGVDRQKRSLAHIIDAFYRFHAEQNGFGCVRWGDKTPANVSSIWRIHATFPDAQYIHVIRDGYDAIYSTLELGNRTLRQSIDVWRYSIITMDRFRRAAGAEMIEIRYEDLVTAPSPTIESVCSFLGVDVAPEMATSEATAGSMGDVGVHSHHQNVGSPVSPRSIGRGRSSWSERERRFVARRIEPVQRRLGYPPVAR